VEPVQVGLDPAALAGVVGLLAGQRRDGGAGIGEGALGLGEQVPQGEGVPVGDRVDPLAQHGVLGLGRGLAAAAAAMACSASTRLVVLLSRRKSSTVWYSVSAAVILALNAFRSERSMRTRGLVRPNSSSNTALRFGSR
jgi:hypothetical protein